MGALFWGKEFSHIEKWTKKKMSKIENLTKVFTKKALPLPPYHHYHKKLVIIIV